MPEPKLSARETKKARLDYDSALRLVMGLADFERSTHSPGHSSFHLERMRALAERLGNPHLGIPTVHVAGTKGKGSTVAMVTSILGIQGYTVGLYTSPHLHSVVERVRVGQEPIGRDEFAARVEEMWPDVEWTGRNGGFGDVTFFEMLTAMAFRHFQQSGVDFQVIEVGLGGRLDSTNIVSPDVCAITPVSLDHVATLGDTVAKIAAEKAGIIKQGVPVVVAPQPPEALEVILEVAKQNRAPAVRVGVDVTYKGRSTELSGQSFRVSGKLGSYDLFTPLLGRHQIENAATAVAVAESLMERGFEISEDSIAQGLREVVWPARFELVSTGPPPVLVDGAHNPHSMKRLVETLPDYFKFKRLIVIFGALGGHSSRGMLAELAELSPAVLAVRSRQPRSAPSPQISAAARRQGLDVIFESENVREATRHALDIAEEGDLVLGTGSLSVAAEVIEELRGMTPELYPYIKPPADPGVATV